MDATRTVAAGAAYFALVFAVGFALGAVRTVALAPRLGETAAVAVELPVMLALSWLACRWCARFATPRAAVSRLVMGGVALALLLVAEAAVGVLLLGRTLAAHLASYAAPGALLGLPAQLAFAAFPTIEARLSR
jgi:hypothetical protein